MTVVRGAEVSGRCAMLRSLVLQCGASSASRLSRSQDGLLTPCVTRWKAPWQGPFGVPGVLRPVSRLRKSGNAVALEYTVQRADFPALTSPPLLSVPPATLRR